MNSSSKFLSRTYTLNTNMNSSRKLFIDQIEKYILAVLEYQHQ